MCNSFVVFLSKKEKKEKKPAVGIFGMVSLGCTHYLKPFPQKDVSCGFLKKYGDVGVELIDQSRLIFRGMPIIICPVLSFLLGFQCFPN